MMYRILKRRFPTWYASPVRRAIQTACLAVFLVLFVYVACPYPTQPARVWEGWTPVDVDLDARRFVVDIATTPTEPLPVGADLHVTDSGTTPPEYLGVLRVAESRENSAVLVVTDTVSPDVLDKFGVSFGPWSLGEQPLGAWPAHYTRSLMAKEKISAELLLLMDPLVSITTAIAARAWTWSLAIAGLVLLACLVIPRGFCGYVCPLGTVIDLFDWLLGRRLSPRRAPMTGWWRNLKYYLLIGVLASSVCGVLTSGFVAAIPVLTRACAFLVAPVQTAAYRGWYQVPPWGLEHWMSVILFACILLVGFVRPRFWCRYMCPTGAVFSATHKLRLFERTVSPTCTGCDQCRKLCPFDAIHDDYTTRVSDCSLCRTCHGVCPVGAIQYVPRWNVTEPKLNPTTCNAACAHGGPVAADTQTSVTVTQRRHFLAHWIGVTAGVAGGVAVAAVAKFGHPQLDRHPSRLPVRPPGSVREPRFLAQCIRCGECFRACPNDAIQPLGLELGLDRLWTPQLVADWSGCDTSCSNCGQVCPTGAIRPLTLDEKRATHMGLAVVNRDSCLPHARREACQLCVDECTVAGYNAIEFLRVGTEVDEAGQPIEDSGFLAPMVLPEKCVGCGLCQTRCLAINGTQKGILVASAIRVEVFP